MKGEMTRRAFAALVDHGYVPTIALWTRLVQTTTMTPEELEELSCKVRADWVRDDRAVAAFMHFYSRNGRPHRVEDIFARYLEGLGSYPEERLRKVPEIWRALIEAWSTVRNRAAAHFWFLTWRYGPAHPYAALPDRSTRLPNPNIGAWALQGRTMIKSGLPACIPSTSALASSPSHGLASIHARTSHSLAAVPVPDSQPYIAMLDAEATAMRRGSRKYKRCRGIIRLMAADRVPLSTTVINSLIHYELSCGKPSSLATVLALYEKMNGEPTSKLRRDVSTFLLVLQTYREPRLDRGMPMPEAGPSWLAMEADLAAPSPDLLRSPRGVICDMLTDLPRHWNNSQTLDAALGACVRARDFASGLVVLQLYRTMRIEPTSKTHVLAVHGCLRASKREEGFLSASSRAWLTPDRKRDLEDRVADLRDLAEQTPQNPLYSVQRVFLRADARPEGEVAAQACSPDGRSTPETWNGRIFARRPHEIRRTRRHECRDTAYLFELFGSAASAQEASRRWTQRVISAAQEMLPESLLSDCDLDSAIRRSFGT